MLSMNSLGLNGRLGNQLFQFASLKGIALNRGHDFCIPANFNNNEYYNNQILENFNLGKVNILSTKNDILKERFFHFDENLFNNCPDNVDLYGYFQSEKYFKHIKNIIMEDFSFTYQKEYKLPFEKYISIHVRRTDYVNQPNNYYHYNELYYEEAINTIGKQNQFVVFSDDIEWCKKQKIFKDCYFFNGKNNIHDLYAMTMAQSNIIANSTFSWWGAWLNKNNDKIVIAPKNWFGPEIKNNIKDLFPEDWICL